MSTHQIRPVSKFKRALTMSSMTTEMIIYDNDAIAMILIQNYLTDRKDDLYSPSIIKNVFQ